MEVILGHVPQQWTRTLQLLWQEIDRCAIEIDHEFPTAYGTWSQETWIQKILEVDATQQYMTEDTDALMQIFHQSALANCNRSQWKLYLPLKNMANAMKRGVAVHHFRENWQMSTHCECSTGVAKNMWTYIDAVKRWVERNRRPRIDPFPDIRTFETECDMKPGRYNQKIKDDDDDEAGPPLPPLHPPPERESDTEYIPPPPLEPPPEVEMVDQHSCSGNTPDILRVFQMAVSVCPLDIYEEYGTPWVECSLFGELVLETGKSEWGPKSPSFEVFFRITNIVFSCSAVPMLGRLVLMETLKRPPVDCHQAQLDCRITIGRWNYGPHSSREVGDEVNAMLPSRDVRHSQL